MKRAELIDKYSKLLHLKNIVNSITNLKHRAIISTIYSCGLRISEAINLKIWGIDSKAMTVKIVNAKGENERYAMLSPKLLELLPFIPINYNTN